MPAPVRNRPLSRGAGLWPLFDAFAADQLVEIALFAARRCVLHHQSQVLLVEFFEPLVPGDRLQRTLARVAGEIQAEHPGIAAAAGAAHAARCCAALLGPAPDFVMVDQRVRRSAAAAARSRARSRGRTARRLPPTGLPGTARPRVAGRPSVAARSGFALREPGLRDALFGKPLG